MERMEVEIEEEKKLAHPLTELPTKKVVKEWE